MGCDANLQPPTDCDAPATPTPVSADRLSGRPTRAGRAILRVWLEADVADRLDLL